ncbi:MAG: TIGR02452 family protein [Planctomycetota bacterium]
MKSIRPWVPDARIALRVSKLSGAEVRWRQAALTSRDLWCICYERIGGGLIGGSQAQEESLARSSALYATLTAAPVYYKVNRVCGTGLYTDHMILSLGVPVFRDDDGLLLTELYEMGFVTAPADSAGAVARNEPEHADEIVSRMRRLIVLLPELVESEGYRYLVLGVWGCGMLRNEPAVIAGLFAEHLLGDGEFIRSFVLVVFAVLNQPDGSTIEAFAKVLLRGEVSST